MIPLLLILVPLFFAAMVWSAKTNLKALRALLLAGALFHFLGTAFLHLFPCDCGKIPALAQWIDSDETALTVLLVTSILFLAVTLHTIVWLPEELKAKETAEHPEGVLKPHIFFSSLLAFLGTMTLVIFSRNFGLLWVAVEATTLTSAPLILFHRSPRSIEAMWKYLLICSVGIGLALFGTMLFAAAGRSEHIGLSFSRAIALKEHLDPRWFKAAFLFILAGYGTKMGLAPFHTWLPDAHSEAPGTVSALLSGSLLNCSFLGILRFCDAAPEALTPFISQVLTALGILSLAVAACFIAGQQDYKRMLAYSSVEHMGLLALFKAADAMNVGMLHLFGHSLLKMALFLTAGNLLLACGTRHIPDLGGLNSRLPRNSALFAAGILLICGMPPSPLFYTEFQLLFFLHPAVAAAVLVLLFIIFAGMTRIALKLAYGPEGKVLPDPLLARSSERLCTVPFIAMLVASGCGLSLIWALCNRSF